tara:strand:- start:259 stop:654 length:396 start_codon:yes stop_codon:yes gene_type:complete
MIELILTIVRFCIVGSSGLSIDFIITWILKEKVRINKYLSNSCGFMIAASSNYYLNRIWTFNSTTLDITTQYTNFILVSIIGLIINNTLIFVFHNKFNKGFYLAKIMAIIITTAWNFIANNFYTFSSQSSL